MSKEIKNETKYGMSTVSVQREGVTKKKDLAAGTLA